MANTTDDIEMRICLPWATTCAFACMAFIRGLTLDALVSEAIADRVARGAK